MDETLLWSLWFVFHCGSDDGIFVAVNILFTAGLMMEFLLLSRAHIINEISDSYDMIRILIAV